MRAGDRIGHLVVERALGAGGMGEVYLARDDRLQRLVAVKLLPADRALDEAARLRMLREARAVSALDHAGIVRVYDIGDHDGRAFLVMEYIEGETLDEVLVRRGRLPAAEAVALLEEIADAVGTAHEAGVLHRDLKPANLMIDRRGRARVLDFGLSKRTGTPSSAPLASRSHDAPATERPEAAIAPTEAPGAAPTEQAEVALATDRTTPADVVTAYGARMGTPGYAAVELMDGAEADRRVDVFSLGVVFYRMLTGELPFPQRTWGELRAAMTSCELVRPSARGVDARFDAVIERALASDRDRRFPDVTALATAARVALGTGAPRPRWPWVAAAAGTIVTAGAAIALTWPWGQTTSATPRDASVAVAPAPDAGPSTIAAGTVARQLTHEGGCAYAPTFVDDRTLVYEYDQPGHDDLFALDRDGAAVAIAATEATDWRPAPGAHPREVVYLSDLDANTTALDDPKHVSKALGIAASSIVWAADAYWYTDTQEGTTIRKHGAAGEDTLYLSLGNDRRPNGLVADPTGRRLGFAVGADHGTPLICTVELATAEVACVTGTQAGARPAFSPDGDALYALSDAGIERLDLATGRADVIAPGRDGNGGLAVSPSGDLLAFASCAAYTPLDDVTSGQPVKVTTDLGARSPRLGPSGELVFVRRGPDGNTIVRIGADGASQELVSNDPGSLVDLAISADGKRVAYARNAPEDSGIYVVDLEMPGPPQQLTSNATDNAPLFVGDDVMFVRPDPDQSPRLYRATLDGATVERSSTPSRLVFDVDAATHRVLAASTDRTSFHWIDPATGRIVRGPKPPTDGLHDVAVSPDGAWIAYLSDFDGGEVFRQRLPAGHVERLYQYPSGISTASLTVGNDGRVIVEAAQWKGELFALSPPPGTTF